MTTKQLGTKEQQAIRDEMYAALLESLESLGYEAHHLGNDGIIVKHNQADVLLKPVVKKERVDIVAAQAALAKKLEERQQKEEEKARKKAEAIAKRKQKEAEEAKTAADNS